MLPVSATVVTSQERCRTWPGSGPSGSSMPGVWLTPPTLAPVLKKILIANRGEIAVRVIRAAREMGIATVAVYSELDRDALHVHLADEAFALGGQSAAESYINTDAMLDAIAKSGADAVHPGYGFFSENADFARAIAEMGVEFIGPPATAMDEMSDKVSSRLAAIRGGAPVVPGTTEFAEGPDEIRAFGNEHGWPAVIKAAFGGGGRGMKVVESADKVDDAFASAQREALAFFGRDEVYVERYLTWPRHVEIQLVGDKQGNCVWISSRDCSAQRRHQKLIEEAPAHDLPDGVEDAMGEAAVKAAGADASESLTAAASTARAKALAAAEVAYARAVALGGAAQEQAGVAGAKVADVAAGVLASISGQTLPGPEELGRVMGPAARGGHLQVATFDEQANEFLRSVKLLRNFGRNETLDFVGLVQTNGLSNKMDLYLHRELDYQVTVGDDGRVDATAVVTLRSEVPSDPPTLALGRGATAGVNKVLLSLYSPWLLDGVTVDGVTVDALLATEFSIGRYLVEIDLLPNAAASVIEFRLNGSLSTSEPYSLEVWHQPLVNDDAVTVSAVGSEFDVSWNGQLVENVVLTSEQ